MKKLLMIVATVAFLMPSVLASAQEIDGECQGLHAQRVGLSHILVNAQDATDQEAACDGICDITLSSFAHGGPCDFDNTVFFLKSHPGLQSMDAYQVEIVRDCIADCLGL